MPSQFFHVGDSIEMIAVQLNIQPKLLIVCLYIPPNCTPEYQHDILHSISNLQSNTNTIILGDFNAPDINWFTLTAESPFSRNLCNTLHSLNYLQLISTPTHQAGNILDLVLTNVPHRVGNINICSCPMLNSDHFMVTADVFSHSNTRTVGTGFNSPSALNYRKADLPALADHLSNALESYDQSTSQYHHRKFMVRS